MRFYIFELENFSAFGYAVDGVWLFSFTESQKQLRRQLRWLMNGLSDFFKVKGVSPLGFAKLMRGTFLCLATKKYPKNRA